MRAAPSDDVAQPRATASLASSSPSRARSLSPRTQRDEGEDYTDAVVTPPSTTMVWPVMKVEASEAR